MERKYWRFILTRFLAVCGILLILLFVALPAYASSWVNYFPIYITDTTGTDRTNVPVLLGITGSALQSGGFINSTGTNTNIQLGSSNGSYMMGTTQVNAVMPSIPAYSTSEIDLYTGYAPAQTAFPIILGNNGYFTTASSTDLDLGNSGNYTFSGLFNPTSTGYLLNNPNSCTIQGNGSGNISASVYASNSTCLSYAGAGYSVKTAGAVSPSGSQISIEAWAYFDALGATYTIYSLWGCWCE